LTAVRNNMDAGLQDLQGTWHGSASDAFSRMISQKWEFALELDAKAATVIKAALEKVADCSRLACEKVLELLKKVIDKLIKAALLIPIPVVGWARAMLLIKDAISLYNVVHALVESVKKVVEVTLELIKTVSENGLSLSSVMGARKLEKAVTGKEGLLPRSGKTPEWAKQGIR